MQFNPEDSDFYLPVSANYWHVFHYFSWVFSVWRPPGTMFCPSTITFHPRRPAWFVGMKLLAVTMELSLVEAAKSFLKEPLKVKDLRHSLFSLSLLKRDTSLSGLRILWSLGQSHWQCWFKKPKSLKKSIFILAGTLSLAALLVQAMKAMKLVPAGAWSLVGPRNKRKKLMIWKDLISSLLVFHSPA